MPSITETMLKTVNGKPQKKSVVHADRDGLYVRISPRGKISFFMRWRIGGKEETMGLGPYPRINLKTAREKNLHYRDCLERGQHPKITKKLEISKIEKSITFGELLKNWYEKECSIAIKNHKMVLARVNNHVTGHYGDLPADKITTHHWLERLEKIRDITPSNAGLILADLKSIYSYAVRRRIVAENPLLGITAKKDLHIEGNVLEHHLSDNELRLLYKYMYNSDRLTDRNRLAMELALHFGCRMSELRLAKIKHFDLDAMVWTVPPENHKVGRKTKKPLLRPIIDEVVPLIKALAKTSDDGIHMITNSRSGTLFESAFWLQIPKQANDWIFEDTGCSIPSWSIHDLRKTMRTNMAPIADPHVCEIMLGHKLPKIWGTYDKYDYLEEQRAAYQSWWHKLQRILADNVVELKKAL